MFFETIICYEQYYYFRKFVCLFYVQILTDENHSHKIQEYCNILECLKLFPKLRCQMKIRPMKVFHQENILCTTILSSLVIERCIYVKLCVASFKKDNLSENGFQNCIRHAFKIFSKSFDRIFNIIHAFCFQEVCTTLLSRTLLIQRYFWLCKIAKKSSTQL